MRKESVVPELWFFTHGCLGSSTSTSKEHKSELQEISASEAAGCGRFYLHPSISLDTNRHQVSSTVAISPKISKIVSAPTSKNMRRRLEKTLAVEFPYFIEQARQRFSTPRDKPFTGFVSTRSLKIHEAFPVLLY